MIMKKIFKHVFMLSAYSCLLMACNKGTGNEAYAPAPSGQGGSLARFAVVGNYLYAVDQENLNVFNITSAGNPSFVRTVKVGFEIETIFPFKDKLFVGSTSVVHIFSIQDPANPTKLSTAISPTVLRRCDPVVAKDNVAYATLRVNGECGGVQSILAVYDITNVLKPVQVNMVPVNEPYGLGYKNDVLYVCDKGRGLLIYDISNQFNPGFIKKVKDADWYIDVIPYNDVLICWTSTGVVIYNITDNKNPVLLATIS